MFLEAVVAKTKKLQEWEVENNIPKAQLGFIENHELQGILAKHWEVMGENQFNSLRWIQLGDTIIHQIQSPMKKRLLIFKKKLMTTQDSDLTN